MAVMDSGHRAEVPEAGRPDFVESVLFALCALVWAAWRCQPIATLSERERYVLNDALYTFTWAFLQDGPDAVAARFTPPLDWRGYSAIRDCLDPMAYDHFLEAVNLRLGEYTPLADAFVDDHESRGKWGFRMGDAIARHLFPRACDANGEAEPWISFQCHTRFVGITIAATRQLNRVVVRPDPDADAHVVLIPDSWQADLVLTCPECRATTTMPHGQRTPMLCHQCRRPLTSVRVT
jgi:hypothetical protein